MEEFRIFGFLELGGPRNKGLDRFALIVDRLSDLGFDIAALMLETSLEPCTFTKRCAAL